MGKINFFRSVLACAVLLLPRVAMGAQAAITVDPSTKNLSYPNPLNVASGSVVNVGSGAIQEIKNGGQFIADAGSTVDLSSATVVLPGTPSTVANVLTVATIAALKGTSVSGVPNGAQILVNGYYAANDGGGGWFIYASGSSAADNGGTIIQPTVGAGRWLRQWGGVPVNPLWFGAKGDNSTDDTTALQAALAVVASGGALSFPGPQYTFILDGTLVVTNPMTIIGQGATLKLKNSAALFVNGGTGLYGRYLLHVRSSDVRIRGLRFDGNSPNNSVVVSAVTRYRYSGANVNSVGCIVVGWVPLDNTPIGSTDISNVSISECEFKDSSDTGISFFNQDGVALFYNCETRSCYFLRGQNVQHDINNCRSYRALGNRHVNAYFASFQFYYNNVACQVVGANTYHKDSEINTALVDPGILSGGNLLFHGYWKLGKDISAINYNCSVKDCLFYGTGIYVTPAMYFVMVTGCTIDSAEKIPGIEYAGDVGTVGNVISNNLIRNCDFPGLYHGGDQGATDTVLYENNVLYGNNQSAAQYGGRDQFANIFLIGKGGVFRDNFARKVGTKPTYGVKVFPATSIAGAQFYRNDFKGSGNTADISDSYPPVGAMIGDLLDFSYTLESSNGGATQANSLDLTPNGSGMMLVSATSADGSINEAGIVSIAVDGSVKLVGGGLANQGAYTANFNTTGGAGKVSVQDNGTNVFVRNETGTPLNIRVRYFYR